MEVEHGLLLGKRERLPHHPAASLANRVVQTLHMSGFSRLLPNLRVTFSGEAVVATPEIVETPVSQILIRQLPPQPLAGLYRAVTDEEREDLPGSPALRDPDAYHLGFYADKGKNLVQFDHIGAAGIGAAGIGAAGIGATGIGAASSSGDALFEGSYGASFFLNSDRTKNSLTPKMRAVARKLWRSL